MENFTERKAPAGLYDPRFEHDNCGIGAVVDIKGRKTHKTIDDALQIVEHLEHRAGKDAEGKTGDGVGILLQIGHKFFKKASEEAGITLGNERDYGIGMFFFPQEELNRNQDKKLFEIICKKEGAQLPWLARSAHLPGNFGPQGTFLHAQHLAGICGTPGPRKARH